ncbi:phospholipid transport system transporter-binding protein [Enterobacter sp. kpr-6]|uniref:lipid asymmetry maintenance protein MlaB n=1 Tax=Enterobacter sp. kpr-6 TaxID=1761782 RepID=UPI0008EA50F1|nr:lipid asymmetry maintenance protein MlaB [Enterobacter sp. kpr-6]SFR16152.1 phospholipid transport system transporter-binding protein [Enterobacter sp. kpr-6]
MTQQLTWTREGERLSLQGELDQDVLNPLWESRVQAMQGVSVIDLSALSRVDTAGVALLVHLIAEAGQQGQSVTLAGVSDKVVTLAQLYNLPANALPH